MRKHILSLGAGSVGRRHLRNFTELGCKVSAMDPRSDRLDEAAAEVSLQHRFTTLEEALAEQRGNVSAAARQVGLSRRAFEYRLKRSGESAEEGDA